VCCLSCTANRSDKFQRDVSVRGTAAAWRVAARDALICTRSQASSLIRVDRRSFDQADSKNAQAAHSPRRSRLHRLCQNLLDDVQGPGSYVSKVFQVCAVLVKEDDFVSHYGKPKERLIRSRPWRPIRVRRVVPGRGMSSQASSHDPNRSSGNKTSEDEEAKNLRIKRLAYKTAIQRGKQRWTQQSKQIVQATSGSVAYTSSSSVSRVAVVRVVSSGGSTNMVLFEAAERLCTRRHVQFAAREDSILVLC